MHNAVDWKSGYMPLIIGGIGAMASALVMPWVTVTSPLVGQITRTGMHLRDGRLFLVGLVVLALIARREARTPKAATRSVLLVGVIVLGAALAVEYRDLTRLVADFNADFAPARLGFGVFAMGIGLTTTTAGVLKRRVALRPSQPSPEQFVGS